VTAVKISLVPMRTLPRGPSASLRPTPARPMTLMSPSPVRSAAAPCPAGVDPSVWSLLALCVDDAQRGTPIANATLRAAVRRVVRDLRAAGESWEGVYARLDSAVTRAAVTPTAVSTDVEMYASRGAAIVSHMHCWADVDRLDELDREDAAG
jgi:hypothetical protein